MIEYEILMPEDRRLRKVYEKYDVPNRIGWPVVVAFRDEEVVGVMGTQDRDDAVVAGPLNADHVAIAFRMAELYENFMTGIGVSSYMFYVEQSNEEWLNAVRKWPVFEEVGKDGEYIWFHRRMH